MPPVQSHLPGIQMGQYKVDPYIEAAVELQTLGRADALVRLRALAEDKRIENRVIVLCRMLFTPRPGSEFRRPGLGGACFLGGTDYPDWPLEPIDLVDGVPFLITHGYCLGGRAESDKMYLDYCEANCDWSGYRYASKSEAQKQDALRKFLASPKWKTPLDAGTVQFLTDQIQ